MFCMVNGFVGQRSRIAFIHGEGGEPDVGFFSRCKPALN